ncbi:MAG: TonB-dependent receptor [Chloracidobacterium sp.]|nr:TonB-dependent receptor [Chloracidobacterium sp.]
MKTNIKLFTLAIFAMVTFLFVTTGMAQTNSTGSVDGVVTDSTGAVVPNAAVTITGANLIRPQTTSTNGDGAYRFLQVPPGRYTISTAPVAGFGAYKQDNVEVNLAQNTTVKITLSASGAGATVDVVATSEIDNSTNTTGSNISTEFFSNIPTSRTVQGLYTIAPTVARSGLRDASGRDRDPSVAGSSGPENSYILDGVTTTDPAFGGAGANLPFEFVQEVQVKTGSYGADQGLSTGGVFNVITKSGTNQFHGDLFVFYGAKGMVRETKNLPQVGLAPNGFSEVDAGADIGGPIVKDKLWFFAAFNPQKRKNSYLTQSFRDDVEGEITTPFYSGKLTWAVNNSNTFTFSTFGDYTKEEGHLFAGSGFGQNLDSFAGERQTGGTNYAFRLNSNAGSKFIGEFSFGLHYQRNNIIPASSVASTALITDNFAILQGNSVASVTQTGVNATNTNIGKVDYVFSPGGSLQRNFVRDGFGLYQDQNRDRWEAAARMQSIAGDHTFKYGFELYQNKYGIDQRSTGPSNVFANPLDVQPSNGSNPANLTVNGFRVTNNFSVCTTRGTVITCPSATPIAALLSPGVVLPAGYTVNPVATVITADEVNNNPFLVRASTRVRDFQLVADTKTDVQSFYIQDDYKITRNLQVNIGGRWDYQQAKGNNDVDYLKLNNFWDNFQPRIGVIWDPFGKGRGKIFANFARYLETPIPLDVNVRAGSNDTQTDKNFNVNTLNAPLNSTVATGFGTRNLGAEATPIDAGLKPQTVNEWSAGFEYEVGRNYAFGMRGIYRPQGSVIEDGSFDDGDHYFLFNPGEPIGPGEGGPAGNTEYQACNNPAIGCFGRARRYYRAVEFTFNRKFADNFSFQSSYVFSSLIGNYEGLFRNDNGQADPNITSLFDLVSLLGNSYGRLPNDRPHQFKFNGSYTTPFKLVVSGNFYAQSGIPFNQLVPHPVYGNNEGFGVVRGTAIIPNSAFTSGVESSVGSNRTPTTWNLDLGFYYPIKMGEGKQLRLTADWFNVTNTQRAVTVDNTFSINSGVAGVAPVTNPFWGSGTIFQYPSALRIGAKFSF